MRRKKTHALAFHFRFCCLLFVSVFVLVFVFVYVFVFVLAFFFETAVGTHPFPKAPDVVVTIATSSMLSPLSYPQMDKYP